MKKYKVNVEGETFEVTVEEMTSDNEGQEVTPEVATTVKKEQPQPEPAVAKKTPVKAAEDIEGEKVIAAVPGLISSIEVNEGDTVEANDVLFILEAMKMENEITAPIAGTVKAIMVSESQDVDTNEVLAVIG